MTTKTVLAFLGTLFFAQASLADQVTNETWFAIMLDGSKIGYTHEQRRITDRGIEHSNETIITMVRGGVPITIRTLEKSLESIDAEPLAFEAVQDISGASMTLRGQIQEDGTVLGTTISAGSEQEQTFAWPSGAMMPEALDRLERSKGIDPVKYEATAFVALSLQSVPMQIEIVGPESIEIFGLTSELIRVEQQMSPGSTTMSATVWMDRDFNVKRILSEVMGLTMEWLACPEECAKAKSNPPEFFADTFIRLPKSIEKRELAGPLKLHISAIDDQTQFSIPNSDEQSVEQVPGGWEVTISPNDYAGTAFSTDVDLEAALSATRWLQSDAEEVKELAERAVEGESSAAAKMKKIESFVARHINQKSLSVGYASALEVARDRSGDCTEHALLVAAMGRAVGIPTRVASGFAYADRYLNQKNVFVPHAWAQAYIDDRWVSFDAALKGFTSGHLALAYGDGDPWYFYDNINAIGNLRIDGVEPL
ncbi:MAG: hypothetical protein DHS20C11_07650 [Lysobacteraceae bacterium]|nr:MAG: hypothetical protein DHS20C11_07650 [Xanthomonadaceae bacterium]